MCIRDRNSSLQPLFAFAGLSLEADIYFPFLRVERRKYTHVFRHQPNLEGEWKVEPTPAVSFSEKQLQFTRRSLRALHFTRPAGRTTFRIQHSNATYIRLYLVHTYDTDMIAQPLGRFPEAIFSKPKPAHPPKPTALERAGRDVSCIDRRIATTTPFRTAVPF